MRRALIASAEKWLTNTCDSKDCTACPRRAEAEFPELYALLKDLSPEGRAERFLELRLTAREGAASVGKPAWASIGFDVGGRDDSSAVAVLTPGGAGLECRYAARLPLMSDASRDGYFRGQARLLAVAAARYLDIVDGPVRLLVDATGLGGPIAELVREELPDSRRLEFAPVVITGQGAAKYEPGGWSVPKSLLVQQLQAALQDPATPFAIVPDFEDADALARELNAFSGKVAASGHVQYAAGSGHDDLVVALMLALHGTRRDDGIRVHSPLDSRRVTQADRDRLMQTYTSALAGRWWKKPPR